MEYVEYIRKGVKHTKKFPDFESAYTWRQANAAKILIIDWYNTPLPKSLTKRRASHE